MGFVGHGLTAKSTQRIILNVAKDFRDAATWNSRRAGIVRLRLRMTNERLS